MENPPQKALDSVQPPQTQGAVWDGKGVHFSLYSEHAHRVYLCLFDSPDSQSESKRIPLKKNDHLWHAYVPDVKPGVLYGFRVDGPFQPDNGLWFNSVKVLADPCARDFGRLPIWDESLFAYPFGDVSNPPKKDKRDNTAFAPLSKVIDPAYDWQGDQLPGIPWNETIIYETHVKGLTQLHPQVPEAIRGTYSGMASEVILDYFEKLGVSAIELLPIQQSFSEHHLYQKKLTNYWGYNTLGWFAPDSRFAATSDPVREFKDMIKAYHARGLEVILDVVYNHTPEGNRWGPMLFFRGIDNAVYYRLQENDKKEYKDFTGCGNTIDMMHPQVLKLVLDSLKYWVEEMHVDGFRFDLACALGRTHDHFDPNAPFFQAIQNDPELSKVKLIAEPWDLGEGGYQLGNFPKGWAEWNGLYRDQIRKFWRGDSGQIGGLATRISGSSDLFQGKGRTPQANINYIISHDGFTLEDLVSYKKKNNLANGEENRDGPHDNFSWNCGIEGQTGNHKVWDRRNQSKRNILATLLLSQGVPMICGGDEFGRSQNGNNNAYCQDNEINWYCWEWDRNQSELFQFAQMLIKLRRSLGSFHKTHYSSGQKPPGQIFKELSWFYPSGREMSQEQWLNPENKTFAMRVSIGEKESGQSLDKTIQSLLLILFNASSHQKSFVLPAHKSGMKWIQKLDTALTNENQSVVSVRGGQAFDLKANSLVLFLWQGK